MNTKHYLFSKIRRWSAGVLTASMLAVLTLAGPASAENQKESFSEVGMDFAIPQELLDTKGTVLPYSAGAVDQDHHTYAGLILYIAAPQEDFMRCMTDPEVSEEELTKMSSLQTAMNLFFATQDSLEDALPDVEALVGDIKMDRESLTELGTAGSYTYYTMLSDSNAYLSGIDQEYLYRRVKPI